MSKEINVLSLGAGTQSSAMALMSAYGDLPRPDYIIFSDTGNEPKVVYEWLDDNARANTRLFLQLCKHGEVK